MIGRRGRGKGPALPLAAEMRGATSSGVNGLRSGPDVLIGHERLTISLPRGGTFRLSHRFDEYM
jgi:hypothetical protein